MGAFAERLEVSLESLKTFQSDDPEDVDRAIRELAALIEEVVKALL